MSNIRTLERQALEELKDYLEGPSPIEPLQRYIEEKLSEAGDDYDQRMIVMMELIRFNLYLKRLPEFKELKTYFRELEEEIEQKVVKDSA